MVALVLKYKKRVKRHFGSYRLIFLRLSRLGYLDIDDFVTEMIRRSYSLMVETERANQSESGGYRTSVHGGGIRGRLSFDISKEQLSFLLRKDSK